ncbi:MAG: DUF4402 domain-containing protein [Novosphingobium sp.]
MFNPPRFLSGIVTMALAMALLPGTAFAAPGSSTTNGAAQAAVIQPLRISAVSPLAFGQITRPTAAGTVVLDPAGAISTTGGVLTSTAIAQSGVRGPGTFTVTGDPGRLFTLSLPTIAALRSGSRLMLVGTFRSNWATGDALGVSGSYTVSVGATLRVGANQTIGTYTGSYAVTVAYQ